MSSRYKGVSRSGNKWCARIQSGFESNWIGTFDNEINAARAYDNAARQLHGEFAFLNFPKEKEN